MQIWRLYSLIGSSNLDVGSNRVGWMRASEIFGAVFAVIEAGVVLGVLKVAMLKTQSDAIAIMWLFAYISTALFLLTGSNYLLSQLYNYYRWTGERKWALASYKALTFFFAFALPYFMEEISSELIVELLN